jgi:DNA-binding IscR family transcriptional regulator
VASWTFLTSYARVLLLVAHDPGVRLRDIAASLDITERSAFSIITDLVEAGYVVKQKDGRRNRYHIQAHLPLPEPTARERTVGEVLALLAGTDATVTCKSAAAAGSPDPGSGQGAQGAAAELMSGDLLPGEPSAPPSATAVRDGERPPSATANRRRQRRDRRVDRER